MANKYRKKPVVIEAMRWDGSEESHRKIADWSDGATQVVVDEATSGHKFYHLRISTLEGEMWAAPGDWIVKGIKGEFYPCKPYIFEATYEPVEGE